MEKKPVFFCGPLKLNRDEISNFVYTILEHGTDYSVYKT
jgi:hypothetical protein